LRLYSQGATIENGFVRLPDEAPWRVDYLAELPAVLARRYDDQVESTGPGPRLDEAPHRGGGADQFYGRRAG